MILAYTKKTRVLLKISKDYYKMIYVDIKEGLISLGSGHTWDVRNSKPATIKGFIGTNPFYVLSLDSAVPVPLEHSDEKELVTPKLLGSLIKIETLAKFLNVKGMNSKEMLLYIGIGALIGSLLAIALVSTGAIPLGETAPVVAEVITEPVPIVSLILGG